MATIHLFWQFNFVFLLVVTTAFLILRQQQLYNFSLQIPAQKFENDCYHSGHGEFVPDLSKILDPEVRQRTIEKILNLPEIRTVLEETRKVTERNIIYGSVKDDTLSEDAKVDFLEQKIKMMKAMCTCA